MGTACEGRGERDRERTSLPLRSVPLLLLQLLETDSVVSLSSPTLALRPAPESRVTNRAGGGSGGARLPSAYLMVVVVVVGVGVLDVVGPRSSTAPLCAGGVAREAEGAVPVAPATRACPPTSWASVDVWAFEGGVPVRPACP